MVIFTVYTLMSFRLYPTRQFTNIRFGVRDEITLVPVSNSVSQHSLMPLVLVEATTQNIQYQIKTIPERPDQLLF